METLTRTPIDWHVESAPFPTETETGDLGQVILRDDRAFAFAIDALGHGPAAARVAAMAQQVIERVPSGERLESIFERCHEQMRGTRGVALCLVEMDFNNNVMSWLSVGNIQAVHIRVDGHGAPRYESLIMRAGVVGDRLPELRASHNDLQRGDMIVLASDGINYGWFAEFRAENSARDLAKALITGHCHGNDDALAVALRYHGRDGASSW